ncbi:MAG: flagellar biosynthetic protein FliO [Sedimentisphaerales bacterium]|nr:flagellar biosynthetic protein FliO [Sedimentisphaerales bacterium]
MVFFDMVRSRKKIVVFLIPVMLGCGVIMLCSAQSSADAEKPVSNSGGTELEKSQSRAKSLFENDPDFLTNSNNGSGILELFFKFMVSILFLVALGVGSIYVSKRFLPKITKLSGKEIRIAETVHLGPRKAVHLLEIGERRFLIGSTNESITRLADLTSVLTELSMQEIDNN